MLKFILLVLLILEVSLADGVSVVFKANDSIVDIKLATPLSSKVGAKYTKKRLISCKPPLRDVVFKIKSEREISIIPQKILKSSTLYSCKTLDGKNQFTFSTKPFGVDDIELLSKEGLLWIEFNDYVDLESLKEHLTLYKKVGLSKTKLQYKILDRRGDLVVVEIKEPLSSREIEVSISKGLTTTRGSTLKDDFSKELKSKGSKIGVKLDPNRGEMTIYDAPIFVPYRGEYALRLFFDDSISEDEDLLQFLDIDGVRDLQIVDKDYLEDEFRDENSLSDSSLFFVDVVSRDFKPNRSYRVTLKKGFTTYYQLKRDISFVVKSGDLPSYAFFKKDEPYISNLGDIGFGSINLTKATLRVERVTPENYRYFVLFADSNENKANSFSEEIFAKDILLESPKNRRVDHKIHISDLAKEGFGVYNLILNYQANGREKNASKVIFVSDIGINAKVSKNQLFISLFSLKSSKPVSDAKIEVVSAKNRLITTAKSKKDGTATIDLEGILAQNPKAIFVTKDRDKNFLLLNDDSNLNSITFEKLNRKKPKYRAYIYPQSDIIRPASELNTLIVLKDRDLKSAKNLPINIEFIRHSDDFVIKKQSMVIKDGVAEFNLSIPSYQRTGAYFLRVLVGDRVVGKQRIDIESFMPPKIEVDLKNSRVCLGDSGLVDVNISASYLFGAKASNLKGRVTLKATKGEYQDEHFRDFNFSTGLESSSDDILLLDDSSNFTLNESGEASLIFPCRPESKTTFSVLDGVVGATVMDGIQPVSKYKKVKIFPFSRVVGVKLSKEIYDKDETVKLWSMLLNPATHKSIDGNLLVKLVKLNWFYLYEDGNYIWHSKKEKIATFKVKAGERLEYKIPQEGSYRFEILDPLTGANGVAEFEVSGWGYSSMPKSSDPRKISLNFKDREYKKGDTLKLSLKSPVIKGQLLVTIENDKVLWHRLYTITQGSASLDIPIDIDLGRGGVVGALAVRATDANSSIVPFRAFGYRAIKSNRRDKEIKLSLDFNTTTKSDSKININLKADRDSKVVISVVDVGILNITEQKPPNPFSFFTPTPTVEMAMFDIYDMVMDWLVEGKLVSFGADGGEALAKRKKHLPPENDERIKPFMVWSKVIETKNQEANFTLSVPDFNGKARVSALAVSSDGVGATHKDLVVKDDVVVKPSLPRFLLAGDKLKLPLKLFNTTEKPLSVELNVATSPNIKISPNHFTLALKPKSQKELEVDVEALKEGSGYCSFEIPSQNYKKDINISTYSPFAVRSFIKRGALGAGEQKIINIPSQFLDGGLILSISDNVLGELSGDLRYLASYPYGCAEQTASRVGALYWAKPFIKDRLLANKSTLFIREGLRKLQSMLTDSGEFAYWLNSDYINHYASAYSADIVLELNSSEFSQEAKEMMRETLNMIVSSDSKDYSSLIRCYGAYILARDGSLNLGSLNMLYEKKVCHKDKIETLFLASAYKVSGDARLADELYRVANISLEDLQRDRSSSAPFGSWKWRFLTASWLKAKYFGLSDSEFSLLRGSFDNLFSTQEKALAIRAVSSYLKSQGAREPMSAEVVINSKSNQLFEPKVFEERIKSNRVEISAKKGLVSYSLDAHKNLPKPIKNSITQGGDFGIEREFLREDGSRVRRMDNFALGEEIYAKVTLKNRVEVKNLMVDMRLPSCFEVVNSRLENHKSIFDDYNIEFEYVDFRDDRVLLATELNIKVENNRVVPNYHTFYIPLRTTAVGKCMLPAVVAEAMYDERFQDYAKEAEFVRVNKTASKLATKQSQNSEIFDFVQDYYRLEASTAPEYKFEPFFKYPVRDFFGRRGLTSSRLMKSMANYNRQWPKREYKIVSTKIKKLQNGRWYVTVEFDFKLKRGHRVQKGKTTQYLVITKEGRDYKIESIDVRR